MSFLRRLVRRPDPLRDGSDEPSTAAPLPIDQTTLDAEERAHELELARFEQERTGDLVRRQQRYANRSWTPPAEGGERRAGDDDEEPR
jgi:hypothetical protein